MKATMPRPATSRDLLIMESSHFIVFGNIDKIVISCHPNLIGAPWPGG